ncbi:helix-turn-helix domain-containing protein [Brevundimonas sp.]|uniref:helix-turn-helix domain-containing protein n=1 Tax=Brevundimonas sp. TaxID=1871086 RepID=UPI003F71C491
MSVAGLHKETLKAEIRIRYGSLRAFEKAKSLAPDSMRDVLRGRASRHAEAALAAELDRPVHELFPDRYRAPASGDSSTNRDNTRREPTAHRLSERVS